ncbi:MAG: AAA family ATPase [Microscillaceae bacterium]|nr:AAA family ATPase [Microscillaceae bacterium]
MHKYFNDTGLCIPEKHFMVDISAKMAQILHMVERGEYFSLNRPRQFGKTTTAYLLWKNLQQKDDYLTLEISFEVSEDDTFDSKRNVAVYFAKLLKKAFLVLGEKSLASFVENEMINLEGFESLSNLITEICTKVEKKVVITIDEVDKASDNLLFMQFLALMRDKYLAQNRGKDTSFHSVILLGVHDIKNLKRKIRPEDAHALNSPWNIAADFTVDMSFHSEEIQSMLRQYTEETQIQMNIPAIAERIHYYTSGYPYLVSKMCKIVEEIIIQERENKNWTLEDLEESFKYLVNPDYTTTLFDDLAKNLKKQPGLV